VLNAANSFQTAIQDREEESRQAEEIHGNIPVIMSLWDGTLNKHSQIIGKEIMGCVMNGERGS
jgi:hypothetical protein